MLVADSSSHCDVCFGSFVELPHCIDCGHVFCSSCLDSICEKTWSPRQLPACPFCRETFTKSSVRKIHVDIKTPRQPLKEIDDDDDGKDGTAPSPQSEAKRLEEKVAKAAASKCSFEEVSELHREIQNWLAAEVKRRSTDQHESLQLSAALLRAILLNCLAYSEASKVAKGVETNLKERLETTQLIKDKLDAELRKQRSLYSQKVRECQELRSELNRLKLTSTPTPNPGRPSAIGIPPRSPSTPSPLSRSASVRSAMTPTPQHSQRSSYFSIPRPSSTTPTASIMGGVVGHNAGLTVGSAPTSNTMASAMKLHTSPTKPRPVPSRSITPPKDLERDEKPPERWMPNTDDESAASDMSKFSYGTSAAARTLTHSSMHPKWMPRFELPPVTI